MHSGSRLAEVRTRPLAQIRGENGKRIGSPLIGEGHG